jgi:translation initiation factor 4E
MMMVIFGVEGSAVSRGVSLPLTTMTSTTDNPQKSNPSRLPSLNQLAARININASSTVNSNNSNNTSSTAAPRPRLAAYALRTGSTSSIATNDSIAVNVPSSNRSISPSLLSASPPSSVASSIENGGEPLTSDKLEKLNQETAAVPEKKNVKVGYKNIPSLDAITARLAKARAISVDGTPKPPEPEMIEDPKTPGLQMKAPEHPLQFSWCVHSFLYNPFRPITSP